MLLSVERNAAVRRIFFRYKLFFFREKFMDTGIAFYGQQHSVLLTNVVIKAERVCREKGAK